MSTKPKVTGKRRILDAAVKLIREKGYNATTVEDLCAQAGVTKGSFFHHFKGKDDLGAAAAQHWSDITAPLFESASYHRPERPLERILAYIDFRRSMIGGELADFTCLAGTLAQEVHTSHPQIAQASGKAITDHALTLEADIQAAIEESDALFSFSAQSLALHTQAVLQGGFILAKATGEARLAIQSIDHLRRYIGMLFHEPEEERLRLAH